MGHRILVETTQVSLYQFRRKRGGLVVQVSFQSVAIALLSFAKWQRYCYAECRTSSHLVSLLVRSVLHRPRLRLVVLSGLMFYLN